MPRMVTSEVGGFKKAKFSVEGLQKSLDVVKEYTFINATAVALNQLIYERRNEVSCEALFPRFYAKKICRDEFIRPTFYEGVLLWVMAYYHSYQPSRESKLDAHRLIRTRIGMDGDVSDLDDFMKKSQLKNFLDEIETDFKEMFKCETKPCDKHFLASMQFVSSSVTDAKSSKYHELKFSSIALIPGNKKLLGNKIPELSGFYRIHFNHTGRIFGGDIPTLLGNHKGKFLSYRFLA